jgi:hypothetical protein
MINFKQQELIDRLFQAVKEKYPEVEFISVAEGPEEPADLWINLTAPDDEDREIELSEFANQISTDILQDYGYLILVMPRHNG